MATYNRALIVRDYQTKWDAMVPTKPDAVDDAALRIVANKAAYKEVEKQTGVPWYFVGVLHMRECDNNMKGCLANGELIVGTNRKTRLVPKGRGPYATFLESAVDALDLQGFAEVKDWSPAVCCYEAEVFNGMGYRANGVASPYVLGATQFYARGKYVRDGVFNSRFVDPQLGIAPVMKRAIELAGGDVPAADLPKVTLADLTQVSRKAGGTLWFKRVWKALSVTGILTSLGMAQDTANQVGQIIADHWLAILITTGVLLILFIKWLEGLMVEDVNDGRATPSGAAS
jgi:lysozyme family protein